MGSPATRPESNKNTDALNSLWGPHNFYHKHDLALLQKQTYQSMGPSLKGHTAYTKQRSWWLVLLPSAITAEHENGNLCPHLPLDTNTL